MRVIAGAVSLAVGFVVASSGVAAASPVVPGGGVSCGSVVHVGDSLSVGMKSSGGLVDRYVEAGVPADAVVVDAVSGRHIVGGSSEGLAAVEGVLAEDPEVDGRCWVVALGTNDVGAVSGAEDASRRVESVLDKVPEGEQVLWVDVMSSSAAAAGFSPERMGMFNDALGEAATGRDNVSVVEWSAETSPDMFTDGIHLTGAGYQQMAQFVADALPGGDGQSGSSGGALAGERVVLTAGSDPEFAGLLKQVLEAEGAEVSVDGDIEDPAEDGAGSLEGRVINLPAGDDELTGKLQQVLEAEGATVNTVSR